MARPKGAATPGASADALPLFYRRPEPVAHPQDAGLKVARTSFAFARRTNVCPVVAAEFAVASADYPIVFAADAPAPLAVVGVAQGNLFVDEDGAWVADAYVPAYVRRYPFLFAEADADRLVLCLDRDAEGVGEGDPAGEALYDGGQPTAFTEQTLAFCREFMAAHAVTQAFGEALEAKQLLVPQEAALSPAGAPLTVGGWRGVDAERFANLDDKTLLDWSRAGWCALVHLHLASLGRFQRLSVRHAARASRAASAPLPH